MHKDEIKQAALELFYKLSFNKTAISDIARACNLGKGTVYLYFASKDDILLAIVDDRLKELARVNQAFYDDPKKSFEEKYRFFIDLLVVEYYRLKYLLFGTFGNVESRMLKDVFVKFDKYREWFQGYLLQMVKNHGLLDGSIGEASISERIVEVVDLLTGRIILYTVKSDWLDQEGLQRTIGPIGYRLFMQYVLAK
jgi:AcrR family transcriptional regulator